jgi:hypothetical protein
MTRLAKGSASLLAAVIRCNPRAASMATNSLLERRAPAMKDHAAADSVSSPTSFRKADASR